MIVKEKKGCKIFLKVLQPFRNLHCVISERFKTANKNPLIITKMRGL